MEVTFIIIVYYPDYDENNHENRLKNAIQKDLKRDDQILWKKVTHTLRQYERMESKLFNQEIKKNLGLADNKKKIKPIKRNNDKIYEFRIPPQRGKGVCRIYFKHYRETIFVFDQEIKTDTATKVNTAFKRYRIIKEELETSVPGISF